MRRRSGHEFMRLAREGEKSVLLQKSLLGCLPQCDGLRLRMRGGGAAVAASTACLMRAARVERRARDAGARASRSGPPAVALHCGSWYAPGATGVVRSPPPATSLGTFLREGAEG